MKKIILMILLVTAGVYTSMAHTPAEQELFLKEVEQYKNELANKAEENRLEFRKVVDEKISEVNATSGWIEALAYIIGAISIGSIIGGIFILRNQIFGFGKSYLEGYVKDKYPNMVKGELKRILEEENEALDNAIAAKTLEARLRRKFPIRVLAIDEDDLQLARQEISVIHEYKNVQYQKVDDYSAKGKSGELVILYSLTGRLVGDTKGKRDGKVSEILADELTMWKEGSPSNIFVLATIENWGPLYSKNFREICNAGQSPYVLDARIMESLVYFYKRQKNLKP